MEEIRTSFSQAILANTFFVAGVMRFLQVEWQRHERDRNAWDIERAEMRSRLAKLEGEAVRNEHEKESLGKHVKMLGNLLKAEREKVKALQEGGSTGEKQASSSKEEALIKEPRGNRSNSPRGLDGLLTCAQYLSSPRPTTLLSTLITANKYFQACSKRRKGPSQGFTSKDAWKRSPIMSSPRQRSRTGPKSKSIANPVNNT